MDNRDLKMKNRYFIVMYVAKCSQGHITGQTSMETDGMYLNKKITIQMIKDGGFKDQSQHIITNIIELSKRDYENWKYEADKGKESSDGVIENDSEKS